MTLVNSKIKKETKKTIAMLQVVTNPANLPTSILNQCLCLGRIWPKRTKHSCEVICRQTSRHWKMAVAKRMIHAQWNQYEPSTKSCVIHALKAHTKCFNCSAGVLNYFDNTTIQQTQSIFILMDLQYLFLDQHFTVNLTIASEFPGDPTFRLWSSWYLPPESSEATVGFSLFWSKSNNCRQLKKKPLLCRVIIEKKPFSLLSERIWTTFFDWQN